MTKIMFVCHGNICRSPMAEFVLKDMVNKKGLKDMFYIASSATSTEEIGNPIHHGTKSKLKEVGISTEGKYAVQLTKKDYDNYDYFIGMDERNIINMRRILKNDPDKKIYKLLGFTSNRGRDIADPWYSGDFEQTYKDVYEGCEKFLEYIKLEQY